jgi:hypothetical protein
MLIPPINSKGMFIFAEPFNSIIPQNQEYNVVGIRSLVELYNSSEQPYETIYKIVGLTESEFKTDVSADIPIVVFASNGNEFFYVPGNRIVSMPDISGVKYKEQVLAIALGSLPIDYNFDLVMSNISDLVYDVIGVRSNVKIVPASTTILITSDEDDTFKALLANKKTVDKSWQTKYLELKNSFDALTLKHSQLETFVKTL